MKTSLSPFDELRTGRDAEIAEKDYTGFRISSYPAFAASLREILKY